MELSFVHGYLVGVQYARIFEDKLKDIDSLWDRVFFILIWGFAFFSFKGDSIILVFLESVGIMSFVVYKLDEFCSFYLFLSFFGGLLVSHFLVILFIYAFYYIIFVSDKKKIL